MTEPQHLTTEVSIAPMSGSADAQAFKALNKEWITALFALEPADELTLGDPQGEIVAKGGQVLIARLDSDVVGCVALIPAGDGVFELSKMAVALPARGRGIGRRIILAAIGQARELGATSLFLGSSTKLADAVHLYESVGFGHVPPDQLGPLPYRRADVFMTYPL